ncbi:MAG: Hsp20/alpha crystallin family protein [Desulfovibrionaceae bacterium]|nr:Hsp20/alpha crystallin family protein [Desulfovibrionaceae bacterium]
MNGNHRFVHPPFDSDALFGQGGLFDRLAGGSVPWKILKAFVPEEEATSFQPTLDIKSGEKSYVILAEIPGVSKDNVKLEVHDGNIILSGVKNADSLEGKEKHVLERRFGSFERKIALPDDADLENITAKHKDGILIITIAKVQPKGNHKTITIS